jgi:2-dehydro-3-deoxyphosphooctonate aldolase (KDO 8-P synthase)
LGKNIYTKDEKMGNDINIGSLTIKEDGPFFVIAGPCVIEDEDKTLKISAFLKVIRDSMDIPIIFKTSYDKANRTSVNSFRGPGDNTKGQRGDRSPCSIGRP